jgi:hypothetical protein
VHGAFFSDATCYNVADVAFLLDSSGSINDVDWQDLLNFVSSVVGQLQISQQEIHVAATRYATDATIQFRLDTSYVKSDIQNRILRIQKVEGQTNLQDAIRITNQDVFNGVEPGDRATAPDVMVIISDGRTDTRDGSIDQANRAKADGIEIIPVFLDIDGDMGLNYRQVLASMSFTATMGPCPIESHEVLERTWEAVTLVYDLRNSL